jgi:hypothetical protein
MAGREPAARTKRSARSSSSPTRRIFGPANRALAEEHVDAVGPAVRDGVLVQRVDAAEDPAADRGPVGPGPFGAYAEPGGVAYGLRDVRSVHQHLRRDAPAVEAGAAETARFHHGDPPACELPGQHVPAAGAHYHQVVAVRGH